MFDIFRFSVTTISACIRFCLFCSSFLLDSGARAWFLNVRHVSLYSLSVFDLHSMRCVILSYGVCVCVLATSFLRSIDLSIYFACGVYSLSGIIKRLVRVSRVKRATHTHITHTNTNSRDKSQTNTSTAIQQRNIS